MDSSVWFRFGANHLCKEVGFGDTRLLKLIPIRTRQTNCSEWPWDHVFGLIKKPTVWLHLKIKFRVAGKFLLVVSLISRLWSKKPKKYTLNTVLLEPKKMARPKAGHCLRSFCVFCFPSFCCFRTLRVFLLAFLLFSFLLFSSWVCLLHFLSLHGSVCFAWCSAY